MISDVFCELGWELEQRLSEIEQYLQDEPFAEAYKSDPVLHGEIVRIKTEIERLNFEMDAGRRMFDSGE